MCLAQGHNAVMPVRLELAAPRSGVKHSTTELQDFVIVYATLLGHYMLLHTKYVLSINFNT